jgi:hypothetical protein
MKKLPVKGSMILKFGGLYLKVITITPAGGNQYVFDCTKLESRHPMVLSVTLLGLHDALDKAAPFMKDPKDILLMSLDEQDQGQWKVIPEEQVEKLEKGTQDRLAISARLPR